MSPSKDCRQENKQLRDLVASLSVTLLRNIALDPPKYRRKAGGMPTARNTSTGKRRNVFAAQKVPGVEKEIAESLEAAGHELMARAVEIETTLQREKWKE